MRRATIFLAALAVPLKGSELGVNPNLRETTLHEMGHAFDFALSRSRDYGFFPSRHRAAPLSRMRCAPTWASWTESGRPIRSPMLMSAA